jgi:hypothetical protein
VCGDGCVCVCVCFGCDQLIKNPKKSNIYHSAESEVATPEKLHKTINRYICDMCGSSHLDVVASPPTSHPQMRLGNISPKKIQRFLYTFEATEKSKKIELTINCQGVINQVIPF